MNFFEYISNWINENPGKATGALIGCVLGILILSVGVLKTVFVIIFIITGIVIGKIKDDNIPVIDQIKGIFTRKK